MEILACLSTSSEALYSIPWKRGSSQRWFHGLARPHLSTLIVGTIYTTFPHGLWLIRRIRFLAAFVINSYRALRTQSILHPTIKALHRR